MPDSQDFAEAATSERELTEEENGQPGEGQTYEGTNQKLTEMQDKYLRLSAEFDNYRKRTLREKIEMTRSAGETVLTNLLPLIDDFDRAMVSLKETESCTAVKEGLMLIYNKIGDFLKQNGVKEMEVLNNAFDSDMHEAITNVPVDDEAMKGKVVDVIQKGYILNEKVIRFPKVVVGE
ncbi:MAG: nucleotide exchange factor GrpE [Bacteroidales bacterium]|nr:nucleotide exchange factor GrpE [Bacteroidales bacterium]